MFPFSTPTHFINGLDPQEQKDSLWFIFNNEELLVSSDKKRVPTSLPYDLSRKVYLGTWRNKQIFAGNLDKSPLDWHFSSLRSLFGLLDKDLLAIAGRALQFLDWDKTHTYCGCCGKETIALKEERCRKCVSCGHLAFPKFSLAVAVSIKKGNQFLLARAPHFPENWYSVIAGYVDPGETLEQCVAREVFEEVGLRVKNITYFGSQPWPFSHSLMAGFTCDWLEGEIKIDPKELSDAQWFDATNLPSLPPHMSISRFLIDAHIKTL